MHDQIDTGLAGMITAADKEIDAIPGNPKMW
jgi:hypothetical protein